MKNFINLGRKLFPITRSITGKGTLLTLKLLKKKIKDLKIKKIKSRTKVYDWVVPDEWNINKAYIEDKFGKKIIDFKKNNLHIVITPSHSQAWYQKKFYLNICIL